MKICFPIQNDAGMESTIFGHFGSAPFFLLFNTETQEMAVIANNDQHHSHGGCNPLKALNNQQVDGIVVGGIGAGALNMLIRSGLKVYHAQGSTVQENTTLFGQSLLPEFTVQQTCSGHGDGQSCCH